MYSKLKMMETEKSYLQNFFKSSILYPKPMKNFTITVQGCSKKFNQPGSHKLQAGSWITKFPSREGLGTFFRSSYGVRRHVPQENFENQWSQIG